MVILSPTFNGSLPPDSNGLTGQIMYKKSGRDYEFKSSRIRISHNVQLDNLEFRPKIRLVFALQGETHLSFNGSEIRLQAQHKNSGILLPVLESLAGKKIYHQGNQEEFVLFLDESWFDRLTGDESINGLSLLRTSYFVVTDYMRHLIRCLNQLSDKNGLLASLQQERLITELIFEVFRQFSFARPEDCFSQREPSERVKRLFRLIMNGNTDGLSIKEIARLCHSNPTTLQHEFKEAYQQSIGEFIRNQRLKQAASLLLAGEKVGDVAYFCGYDRIDSFSRAFKKMYQLSPQQLKESSLGQSEKTEKP
ncbi:AraC family transcriptional regulator [Kerstersia gyiorum]|nr:AraC family transcriptional regulator [Kerstersia gyiorum]